MTRNEKKIIYPLRITRYALRRCGGFTLLELMISIALIGIIALIIAGAMRFTFRSLDSGERKIEALERIRTSLNIMDSQIQSESPLTYDDDGVRKYYFKGEKKSMQFSTNHSVWNGQMGYVLVIYTVSSNDRGGQVLYVSENTIGMEGKRETKLLDSFNEIYFEYFYKEPTEEEGSWVGEWTDENNIPEKIRLHLVSGVNDFSMIIPMRARSLSAPAAGQPQPLGMRSPVTGAGKSGGL